MDKDNIFSSCSFHMDIGDVCHVLIKDLVGDGFAVGLNESTGETTEDEVEIVPEGEVYLGTYGSLYNWYAIVDPRNIANTGWHVPTAAELTTLAVYLGGEATAGGRLKSTGFDYWNSPNTGAVNNVGFNLNGAGNRMNTGEFLNTKSQAYIWTTTSVTTSTATIRAGLDIAASFYAGVASKLMGNVVRLIKDTTTLTNGQTGTYVGNDGTVYNTICIGTQEWISSNLAETQYRNSTSIEYGALYNWYAATDARNICPIGWHIPSWAELMTLVTTAGGVAIGAFKLMEVGTTYWIADTGHTNILGFNARGSGSRGTPFNGLDTTFYIWSTDESGFNGYYLSLTGSSGVCTIDIDILNPPETVYGKTTGMSLRYIKDDAIDTGSVTGNDGKVYLTTTIGTQVWTTSNSCETKYRNGDLIPVVSTDLAWDTAVDGAMCYYDNDIDNAVTVGDTIPEVTDDATWGALTTGAMCYYDNTPV